MHQISKHIPNCCTSVTINFCTIMSGKLTNKMKNGGNKHLTRQMLFLFCSLKEIGYSTVTAHRLINFKTIMDNSVYFNESINFLPKNINIIKNIFIEANVSIDIDDSMVGYKPTFKQATVYDIALKYYLKKRLHLEPNDDGEFAKLYPSLQSRSISSIEKTAKMLEQAYNMPAHKLPKHFFREQPHTIQNLLGMGSIYGIDICSIISMTAFKGLDRLIEVAKIAERYEIPAYTMAFSKQLFYMQPNLLEEHLATLLKFPRGKEFLQHIAIGKLLLRMSRIRQRIESMNLDYTQTFNERLIE